MDGGGVKHAEPFEPAFVPVLMLVVVLGILLRSLG